MTDDLNRILEELEEKEDAAWIALQNAKAILDASPQAVLTRKLQLEWVELRNQVKVRRADESHRQRAEM